MSQQSTSDRFQSVLSKIKPEMTSRCLVLAALISVAVAGYEVPKRFPSQEEINAQCQAAGTSSVVFADRRECQLYYNCSDQAQGPFSSSGHVRQLQECPYPRLFSEATSSCQPFDQVDCGHRDELVDQCDYLFRRRGNRDQCRAFFPSCKGLSDGVNINRMKHPSPYYVICRSQRTVRVGTCPRDPALGVHRFPHPEKHRCVTMYEMPNATLGYEMTCAGKEDGNHLDDVTKRPDVFYNCKCGQLGNVQKCPKGLFFDEALRACSVFPLRNRIMGRNLSCVGKEDGPHLNDVTKRPDVFYNCECGQVSGVQTCSRGLNFDEVLGACSANPLRNKIMGIDRLG